MINMSQMPKTISQNLRKRNLVKIPDAVIEMTGLNSGDKVDVTWGKNFECVIITRHDSDLSANQKERIRILTCENLDGR